MLKLESVTFVDEEGNKVVAELPEEFKIQISGSSKADAFFALGGLLAKGYVGIKTLYPDPD